MLIDNKLLLFGGKGGVGKTSCAAATAIYAASKGKKTLILSTDPAHSLSDSFGKQIGNKTTKIRENLYALEIDAESLLDESKRDYGDLIKQIADEGTFFSKEDIEEFFDLTLPGMDELMALIKITYILEENRYDLLILDTAPTGHTIRLLELPDLMVSYVKVLAEMRQKHRVVVSMMIGKYVKDKADEFIEKMHRDITQVKATLKDPDKTAFIPVTIPEAMSVYETERLIYVLEKHQIPLHVIFINKVMNENCGFCRKRRQWQEEYIREMKKKFSEYEIKEIPLFANEIREESLEVLSNVLSGEEYKTTKLGFKEHGAETGFDALKIKQGLCFILFGGKGGVGKTSCAAAVALHESKNRKVLVFSTDPAHSLSDSFGVAVGESATKIRDNLYALEIDPCTLLNELRKVYRREMDGFFRSVFKSSATYITDAPYDRKVMEDLFDLAPPGVDEIMALKTMMDLMEKKDYDLFILDTAPTGHTIRLLEMPELAVEWITALLNMLGRYPIPSGVSETLNEMLETVESMKRIMADTGKTEFIIVTTPESMALMETKDLIDELRRLNIPVEYLIINNIFPESGCGFCTMKRAEQLGYIEKLKGLGLKTVDVELFDREVREKDLERLSNVLYGYEQ